MYSIFAGPVLQDFYIPTWLGVLFISFCFVITLLMAFVIVSIVKRPSQQKQEGYHPSTFFIAFIIAAILAFLAFARYYTNGGRF